ncbi:23S rRNA pseudouridine(2604) synthase RluF [Pseudoalteromonas sp. BDTF-M6]|uniref:23S rRNA pseudouridine(2604) synthase RluF n=1 Tax=Pseudoalteromonas sp. BDTF-M6 TaxID=2796132 RepID=UPI001BB0C959|nr:23S rRNA pseudouridine(2604) synthase RluF [Pseudoalteromonas sp. BDTF-M6]MBS3797684.1 23S rRNA pseudouridine(2604) synthase RluF [Pseudoalteromonas sp. BDTF-M6]
MSQATRLNKYISETGFCSRREADALIAAARVTVNGRLPQMGDKVSDADDILVDGKALKAKPKRVYIAYHKPVGVTCTTERKIKSNIVSAINYPERIFPIGRLDRPSEGLIFLTNEGDIVNKILRSGNNHEKEYEVVVDKPLNKRFVERMAQGIPILGTVTKKCKVEQTGTQSFRIILTQGLNRQIRRMCEYLGYEVTKLKRTRIMNVTLSGLKPGQWRHLSETEMATINALIANSGKTEEHSQDAPSTRQQPKQDVSQQSARTPAQEPRAKNPGRKQEDNQGSRTNPAHNTKPGAKQRSQGKPYAKPATKSDGKPFGRPSGKPSDKPKAKQTNGTKPNKTGAGSAPTKSRVSGTLSLKK